MKIELNNIVNNLYNCRDSDIEGCIIVYNIHNSVGISFIYRYSNYLEKIGEIPSKSIFSKYIFKEFSEEELFLLNNSITIYSFKCSKGIRSNIFISVGKKKFLKFLGRGVFGSTIYHSILNGIYFGGDSYKALRKVSFKSDIKSLIKKFRPVIIKGSNIDIKRVLKDDIKYIDKISLYEDFYHKYGFKSGSSFRNFLRFNIRGRDISGYRYGYIDIDGYNYPFIDLKSQFKGRLLSLDEYDIFIVRDLKYLDNILNPPYIVIDIEKDLNHLYFGDIFG